ncbi:synaptic vesicle glycoprotein 2A-like [Melitaea cinxia]|uniref:synaptic vesicle glycoprotein 2A-like n=1 Tax=Melitaea cinxia TaxID=113334 RepID=UPI001E27172D|nr:synaptic vesicle glycoprotein 2A-like [Melitaea cinxia]
MQEYDAALKACGVGLFHIRLLCSAFVALVSGIVITNTTPYILPIAECDLDMNLLQKGLLNAMPYTGMILVSIIAGFLTDTFGRKPFILLGYGGLFVFTVISGTSQTYIVLVIAKFFEGLLFATCFTPVVSLTSEFCHNGIRDRILFLQSSFASVSQILVALISWAILPNDWMSVFFNGALVLNTWNFYLFIMSLWSISACFMYTFLPESPKYCITQKRYDDARETLIKIYVQNTRKPADTYPFVNIWKDKTKIKIDESTASKSQTSFSHMLSVGLHNIKPIFHRPLGLYALLFCTTNFFIMNLFNVIRLWFPQLSTIVEHYATEENQDLCVMLDTYTLGGVLVNKVGKKNLFIVCSMICASFTLALRWANSKIAMVAMFSSIVALAQMLMSLNQFLVVDHFPTTTRSLAIGLIMTTGRIGTLVGNVIFPVLLDIGCVVPFFTMAGTMAFVTLLSFVIPVKKR